MKQGFQKIFYVSSSDLEAALLTASDFEINLANRATMEDVWQEAVEFNNADFDELFKSANADIMLMMSLEQSQQVLKLQSLFTLTGDNVGNTWHPMDQCFFLLIYKPTLALTSMI